MKRHPTKPLRPDLPRTVPCKLAFVGEAPSDEEELAGLPLVGPAGRLFDSLLRCADIDRRDVLVTNVLDVKLEGNKIESICAGQKEMLTWENYKYKSMPVSRGNWLRPEYVGQIDRLYDELRAAKPTVVVPLGGTALWALTSLTNIAKVRGTVLPSPQSWKLVPTLHPAAIFHTYKMLNTVVADFRRAATEAEFPEIRRTERRIVVEPSLQDITDFNFAYLERANLIAVDIETPYHQIGCIGFASDKTNAIVIPFVDERKPNRSYWDSAGEEKEAWNWVRTICENDTPKVLQNGLFDLYWLWRFMGIRVNNYCEDTRLLHHALYPELPKDLMFLGSCYTDAPPWKGWRTDKSEKRDD